jgi:hypothetical protein
MAKKWPQGTFILYQGISALIISRYHLVKGLFISNRDHSLFRVLQNIFPEYAGFGHLEVEKFGFRISESKNEFQGACAVVAPK